MWYIHEGQAYICVCPNGVLLTAVVQGQIWSRKDHFSLTLSLHYYHAGTLQQRRRILYINHISVVMRLTTPNLMHHPTRMNHHELKGHRYKSPASSIFQIANTLLKYISLPISLLATNWQRNGLSSSTFGWSTVFNSTTLFIKFYKLISSHYIKTFNWSDNYNVLSKPHGIHIWSKFHKHLNYSTCRERGKLSGHFPGIPQLKQKTQWCKGNVCCRFRLWLKTPDDLGSMFTRNNCNHLPEQMESKPGYHNINGTSCQFLVYVVISLTP